MLSVLGAYLGALPRIGSLPPRQRVLFLVLALLGTSAVALLAGALGMLLLLRLQHAQKTSSQL